MQQDRAPQDGALRFDVTGTVVTAPEGRRVRIAHDDIPGYMAPMTMAFTLADGESTALAPGDSLEIVHFIGGG